MHNWKNQQKPSLKSPIFSQKSLSVTIPSVVTIYPQKGWIFRRTDLTIPFEREMKKLLFNAKSGELVSATNQLKLVAPIGVNGNASWNRKAATCECHSRFQIKRQKNSGRKVYSQVLAGVQLLTNCKGLKMIMPYRKVPSVPSTNMAMLCSI